MLLRQKGAFARPTCGCNGAGNFTGAPVVSAPPQARRRLAMTAIAPVNRPDIAEKAEQVLEQAAAAGIMVATAESCTGGLLAAALTAIEGESNAFDRGFVTYTGDAKQD